MSVCWANNGNHILALRQPTRVGFGSQLLQRLLPHQLGAQVEMKFGPDGLKADISIEVA
jgi:two-component sensor histidine kinase